jgi:2',3'-cyclic-nucleotide 2'-phosphodiesterase (5'-nucleotidase family)
MLMTGVSVVMQVDTLNAVGIDVVSFGNHEADVPFNAMLDRIKVRTQGPW